MKKTHHTTEQIIRILREAETSGQSHEELCRQHNISSQTFYRWKSKYGGMSLRRECLNRELIYTLSEGRVVFEDWRRYYNEERPHRSLGLQTPAAFAKNQREQGSGSSRATPAFHRNLEWKQNNKPKPPETRSSKVV